MIKIDSFIINPETKNFGEIISRPSSMLLDQFLIFNPHVIFARLGDNNWIVVWGGNLRSLKRLTVRPDDYALQIKAIEEDMLKMAIWHQKQLKDAIAKREADTAENTRKKRRSRPGRANRMASKNGKAPGPADARNARPEDRCIEGGDLPD
jgi:hypothetical protein